MNNAAFIDAMQNLTFLAHENGIDFVIAGYNPIDDRILVGMNNTGNIAPDLLKRAIADYRSCLADRSHMGDWAPSAHDTPA